MKKLIGSVFLMFVFITVSLSCAVLSAPIPPTPTPTLTPIPPTDTPVPTNTPIPLPSIGVSVESFQSAFEKIGFTFNTYENVQGDFTSADARTWVMLVLAGPKENLSSASLNVLNGTDKEKVTQILNLFFEVAFPDKTNRTEAMDWFANKSGFSTGQDKGETTIGNINLSWAKDEVIGIGFVVFVNPKTP